MTLKTFLADLLGIKSTVVTVYPPDYETLKTDNANLKIKVENLQGIVTDLKTTLAGQTTTITEFASLDELKQFLKYNDENTKQYVASTHDCDDFAIELQRAALSWNGGRIINAQLVNECTHMLNTAVIGNSVYKIEPQTDEITLMCNLD